MHSKAILVAASLLLAAFCLAGCATYRGMASADLTDFITGVPGVDHNSKLEFLPFNHSWTNRAFSLKKYSSVYVAPVTTRFIKPGCWVNSMSAHITSEKGYRAEVDELAGYFREQVAESIRAYDKNSFKIAGAPGHGTLCLELALTEVVFSRPAAYAGSMASPVPGTSSAVDATLGSSVAFELRLRDAGSGEVVFTAADRRTPPAKVLDLNKLSFTSSAREICQEWAGLFAQFLNMDKHETLRARKFKVKPW